MVCNIVANNEYMVFIAALGALIIVLMHCFAAGRLVVPPLIDAKDISKVPKYFHYCCWHIVSILLIMMAVGFLYCAFYDATALAVFLTVQAGLFICWSAVLNTWKKLPPMKLLQWLLFMPPFVFGLLGLL